MRSLSVLVAGYHHRANILGAHVFIHGLVRALRDRGHRVTFLQVARPDHRVSIDGVRMIYLGARAKRLYPLRYALRRLASFDVIHTHYVAGSFLGLRSRAAHRAGIGRLPMVAQFHVPEVSAAPLRSSNWRWKYLAMAVKCAPVRLTPTRWLAGALGDRYGVDPSRFNVIPYGIGSHWFRTGGASAMPRGKEAPRVVLVNMKGVEVALDAFARIPKQRNATLECFGTLPRGHDFEGRARALGIAERVRFRGFVPNEDLPARLEGASLLLHPNASGNMDQVLLETQALGIAAVTSRVNGNPECVEEGRTALLCPVGDRDGFARAMAGMLERPEVCARFGEAARNRARDRFHWDRVAPRLEDEIYRPLANGENVVSTPEAPSG